jgi:NitT/TauT family transport system permease protein
MVVKAQAPGRPPAAVPRWRTGRGYTAFVIGLRVALLLAVLVLWQLGVTVGFLDTDLFSDPVAVIGRVVETVFGASTYGDVTIYTHILRTLQAIVVGYAIGAATGVVAGYALGRSKLLGSLFRPYVTAFVAIPKVALVPLLVLIFGIGIKSEIANVVLLVTIMVLFNTFSGVRSVKEDYVSLARIMGTGEARIAARIVLPAAMPSIMVGLRTGVSFAMIGGITAEFIASDEGLGWLIHQATASYDPTGLFTGIVYLVVLTWGLGRLVQLLERRALRWMP